MIKGIDYYIQSASNKYIIAHFKVGFFYHEGKRIKRDIIKSIYHYKEASSFNHFLAKNNLGIIYKNGIDNEIPKNIGLAIAYFDEAIRRNNTKLAIYNLSHIYIYEDGTNEKIDKAIDLLIRIFENEFFQAKKLLCIALVKKHGFDIEKIKQDLLHKAGRWGDLPFNVLKMVLDRNFFNEKDFKNSYQYYKNVDFVYDFEYDYMTTKILNEKIIKNNQKRGKDISSEFYEGFGFDILHI